MPIYKRVCEPNPALYRQLTASEHHSPIKSEPSALEIDL
jgi:hypothetical protein